MKDLISEKKRFQLYARCRCLVIDAENESLSLMKFSPSRAQEASSDFDAENAVSQRSSGSSFRRTDDRKSSQHDLNFAPSQGSRGQGKAKVSYSSPFRSKERQRAAANSSQLSSSEMKCHQSEAISLKRSVIELQGQDRFDKRK